MDIKFVIFVFISTFLVAAIYSSSSFVQYAFSIESYCAYYPDGKSACIHIYEDEKGAGVWICSGSHSEDTYSCETVVRETSPLPPGLNDALDTAIQESRDATKIPNTDLLQDGGFVDDGSKNDTEVPRKQIGNLKFGDITDLNNDTKPSVAQKDLDDQDISNKFEIQDPTDDIDNKSKD